MCCLNVSVIVFVIDFVFVCVIVFWLVRPCLLILQRCVAAHQPVWIATNPRTAFSWIFGPFGAGSSSGILLSRHLNKSTFAPKSSDYVSLFLLNKIYLQGVLDRVALTDQRPSDAFLSILCRKYEQLVNTKLQSRAFSGVNGCSCWIVAACRWHKYKIHICTNNQSQIHKYKIRMRFGFEHSQV